MALLHHSRMGSVTPTGTGTSTGGLDDGKAATD
jgi:hypothetical protein